MIGPGSDKKSKWELSLKIIGSGSHRKKIKIGAIRKEFKIGAITKEFKMEAILKRLQNGAILKMISKCEAILHDVHRVDRTTQKTSRSAIVRSH